MTGPKSIPHSESFSKGPFNRTAGDLQVVYELLKKWGIFNLPYKANMEFCIAFEAELKETIGNYEMTQTLVREVHVPRPRSYEHMFQYELVDLRQDGHLQAVRT